MREKRLYLGGVSALECWTAAALGMIPRPRKTRTSTFAGFVAADPEVRAFDLGRRGVTTVPYSILVPSSGSNRKTCLCRRKRMAEPLPRGSFFEIDGGILIAAPELCAIQCAESASALDAAVFYCELCGNYAVDASRDGKLVKRPPLTTAADLVAFFERLRRLPGIRTATKAARIAVDNSCSPMESKLAVLLSAPGTLGGFGLPTPVMNREIAIVQRSSDGVRKAVRKPDLLWEGPHVALEYDSAAHHQGEPNVDRDSRRRNALVESGITVFTATPRQVLDCESMVCLAGAVARALKARPKPRVADFDQRNARAHREVMLDAGSIARPAIPHFRLPLQ